MSRDLCERLEDQLGELIDREARQPTPAEPAAGRTDADVDLLEHARQCSRCRDSLESYRKTVALLRQLPEPVVPADFLSWVREGVDGGTAGPPGRGARGRTRTPWSQPLWLGLAATLVVAAGIVGFSLLSERGAGPELAMDAPAEKATDLHVQDPEGDRDLADALVEDEPEVAKVPAGRPRSATRQEAASPARKGVETVSFDVVLDPAGSRLEEIERRLCRELGASELEKSFEEGDLLVAFHLPRERLGDLRQEIENLVKLGEPPAEAAALSRLAKSSRAPATPDPDLRLRFRGAATKAPKEADRVAADKSEPSSRARLLSTARRGASSASRSSRARPSASSERTEQELLSEKVELLRENVEKLAAERKKTPASDVEEAGAVDEEPSGRTVRVQIRFRRK